MDSTQDVVKMTCDGDTAGAAAKLKALLDAKRSKMMEEAKAFAAKTIFKK